jgi:hypothetical protein
LCNIGEWLTIGCRTPDDWKERQLPCFVSAYASLSLHGLALPGCSLNSTNIAPSKREGCAFASASPVEACRGVTWRANKAPTACIIPDDGSIGICDDGKVLDCTSGCNSCSVPTAEKRCLHCTGNRNKHLLAGHCRSMTGPRPPLCLFCSATMPTQPPMPSRTCRCGCICSNTSTGGGLRSASC